MNNTNPKVEIPNNTNLAEKLTISTKNNFKYRYLSRDQLLYADDRWSKRTYHLYDEKSKNNSNTDGKYILRSYYPPAWFLI